MSRFAYLLRSPWPLAVVVGVGAAYIGLQPSADGDIWWHLAAGREMVARGSLLFSDPFSVSAQGRPWIDVHWLFQLAVYAVNQWLGLGGLVLIKCALVGLGATLLYWSLEARRGSWAKALLVAALLAGLLAARSLLLVRPVIGTLVLLAFFMFELERFGRDGRLWRLLLLPLAQVVWANFQGLSALGPFMVGAYALGMSWQRARALLAACAACLLALCVTPFGLAGATLPAVLLERLLPGEHQVFAQQVAENLPPFELERLSGEFWHFKWSLLLLALSVVLAGRRLRASHAVLLLGFAALALMSNRNVLLLYWVGAPIFAVNVAPTLRRWVVARFRASGLRVAAVGHALLVSGLLLVSATAAAQEPSFAQPSPFRAPLGSAQKLSTLPGGGDVFSADHHGGYLIWRLYPRFRPYLDTRLVLRTADEFAEYLRIADEPERFDEFQRRHHFSYVVLPVMFPERYQRLIAQLYASPDWKLLFTDGAEVLFGRRDLTVDVPEQPLAQVGETARLLAQIDERYGDSTKLRSAARLSLATLHGLLGQFSQAEQALADVDGPTARALAARFRFAAGDLATAETLARQRLAAERDDVGSLNLLALIALRRGDAAQGLELLRRALRLEPYDPEATQLLANLEEKRR